MAKRSSTPIAGLTDAQLRAELARRTRRTAGLHRRRQSILRRLARLDAKILALGGEIGNTPRAGSAGRTRPKNDLSLADALRAALKGKTLGVAEAMEAVQKAGYRSNSRNFRTMVTITLGKTKGIKRVSRGQYSAK